MIYHLTHPEAWQDAAAGGVYRHPSLSTEGFIHCSTREQLADTANRYFTDAAQLVALEIAPDKAGSEVRWENGFPHLYGPLPVGAVTRVVAFPPAADGRFVLPGELA